VDEGEAEIEGCFAVFSSAKTIMNETKKGNKKLKSVGG